MNLVLCSRSTMTVSERLIRESSKVREKEER